LITISIKDNTDLYKTMNVCLKKLPQEKGKETTTQHGSNGFTMYSVAGHG